MAVMVIVEPVSSLVMDCANIVGSKRGVLGERVLIRNTGVNLVASAEIGK